MENYNFEEIHRRLVKSFLDVIILRALMSRPMSSYDVMVFISKKFDVFISAGTVYSTVYSMERQELIEGGWHKRTRVYNLAPKGKQIVNLISKTKEKFLRALANLLAS